MHRKMTSLYPVPHSFFIGCTVVKKFDDTWCKGTVDWVDTDEGETLWHVTYQDFDEEQMTRQELSQVLRSHPMLNPTSDLQPPELGHYVWYAVNQQPRLGKVTAVDPTVPRPVVVEVYEPQANASSLPGAKFRRATDPDTGEPCLENITLHQIQLSFPRLTPRGLLYAGDRKKLLRCLQA